MPTLSSTSCGTTELEIQTRTESLDYVLIKGRTRRLLGKPAKSFNLSIYYIGWNLEKIKERMTSHLAMTPSAS